MEGRKKSAKELLEERQMKRYFRSKKRSKGKNRKENNQPKEEVKEGSKKTNCAQNATIKDQTEQPEKTEKQVKTSSEPVEQNLQKGSVKGDSSEDLSDWEIVQHPKEDRSRNRNENTSNNRKTGMEKENNDIGDGLVETIDQNKAWVEEMNKVNEKISSELGKQMKETNKNTCDETINKETIIESKIPIGNLKNTKSNNSLLNIDKSIEGKMHEKIEDQSKQLTKKEQIQEFSPTVYWREPLPDIAPLEVENMMQQKIIDKDVPKKITAKTMGKNKNSDKLSLEDKINAKNPEKSKAEKTDNLSSFGCDPQCLENVWLDKCKYEDAEVKYYQNIARQLKTEVKQNIIETGKNVDRCSKSSNGAKPIKVKNTNIKEIVSKPENIEVKHKSAKDKKTNLSLEDQLKRLEAENIQFKQSLSHLSYFVRKLEERVTNLEGGSLTSSMTDEGVDMTGECGCPFFDDCVCNSDSDEIKQSLTFP